MSNERHGNFPFYRYAARYDVWDYTPLDQGGRFVQLQVIGSEKDADITAAVRRPGFFDAWGVPIGWDSLEKTELEKSVWLNRWYYLPSFARRYFLTGERGHLEFMTGFVDRWVKENPRPRRLREYFATGRYNWRDMQVAWRAQNLVWCYFLCFEALGAERRRAWRKVIATHARVLLEYFGRQPLHENNHQSHGALAMLLVGVLFPDFRDAATLRRKALRILEHHLEHAFYADGNSVELCPGYYPFFVAIFRDAWLLCRENGLRPPARSRERLEQFFDYMRRVRQPDGTMPPINDSSESASGTSVRILGDLLERADEAARSHWFRDSHQVVLRDGATLRNMYVFADAGPQILWHWHGGKLGFHFWAGGRPWLVDSGVCNYDHPLRNSWFTAPESHNTLLVDGEGDYRRTDLDFADAPLARSRVSHVSLTKTHDHVVMTHGAFARGAAPVKWRRHLVLAHERFLLVVDELKSGGGHRYEFPFHFAPCRVQVAAGGGAIARAGRDALGVAVAASGASAELHRGRGAVSRAGRNVPAPMLRHVVMGRTVVTAAVFAPMNATSAQLPALELAADEKEIRLRVRRDRDVDEIFLSRRGARPAVQLNPL